MGLLRETSGILLDAGVDRETIARIKALIEADADNRVADLHVWNVGGGALSLAVSIVTHFPKPTDHYRQLLTAEHHHIQHSTIEVTTCGAPPCLSLD